MRSKRNRFFNMPLARLIIVAVIVLSIPALLVVSQQTTGVVGCAPQSSLVFSPDTIIREPAGTQLVARPESAIEIGANTFGLALAQDTISNRYANASVLLQRADTVQFDVSIPVEGDYILAFDAAAAENTAQPEGQLQIDGDYPVSALQRFTFPIFYHSSTDVFPRDRYGNEALIRQVREVRWSTVPVRDPNVSTRYPLQVRLSAGEHQFTFTLTNGELYLGNIFVQPFAPYPDYETYLEREDTLETSGISLALEAELPTYKNDTSVRPASSRNLTVSPYDTYCQLMNTLGGDSWINNGSAVYYEFNAPQDGMYAITLRAMQNTRTNFTVFRRITVNGEVPFEQFNTVAFPFSADWVDIPLGGSTPYRVHLREGVNVIGIEATNAPYLPAIQTIQEALLDINTLALEINRLTGNQRDPFREWVISDYIPDIQERLNGIAQNLIDDQDTILSIDQNGASPEILTYRMAIENVLFLAQDPDILPISMTRFSEGTGSAAQLLGSLLPLLQNQPLALDRIIIHSPDVVIQTPSVPVTTAIGEEIRRFIYSFQPDPYQVIGAGEDELEVWVNRPRQYVNLLQLMTDTTFTLETGIRVKFSIMPDEAKLILANAAGTQPDVALGVSTDRPYELAIRNALYDLRTFEDFDSYISIYEPGSLLGYIIDESVYAIPETQDFWVTYYREDVFNSLGLPIPRTWDEVTQLLPELQRYGLNYSAPLSSGSGQRGYLLTTPYLFNYGANLYSEGGFATGLQSDEAVAAVRFMAESFTIYGMPLTTVSFYDSFRYGRLPIGVSNAETYMKLVTTAPEIDGRWSIDLYPATVLEDGTQNRYATGSAQTSIMFRNTDRPDDAWRFMQWWMSTETQTEFQDQLILNYGRQYLWFSANVEAFSQLDIPEDHRNVILEQWEWLQEPIRLPGSYMQERELSNIWNRIVFDGVNPRVAIDRSVIIINREITRKMEEFGYLQNGQRVREFNIPTIELVIGWMENAD